MYSTIRFFTAQDVNPLEASILNRPLSDLARNVDHIKNVVDSLVASDNLLEGKPCSSSVAVGSPVGWNASAGRFELALAGTRTSLGVCVNKDSDTLCDIRILGYDQIDLTASAGSASPSAGLYYLSQTVPGALTTVRPESGVQQPVLYADGQGGVYLLYGEYMPLAGPQGVTGATGAAGAPGAQGAQGPTGPAALPSFVSGQWYAGPINFAAGGNNHNYGANKIIAVPFAAPGGAVLSDLAVYVMAAGNPGDEGRLAIYSDNGNYPGSLLTAANGVYNAASAGAKVVSINNTTIRPGQLVWLVTLINSGAFGLRSTTCTQAWAFKGWGNGLREPAIGYIADKAYGEVPGTFPLNADEIIDLIPTIFAKVN